MLCSRLLNLPNLLKKKSFFLFGPRATGKTTLIKTQFGKDVPYLDLLDNALYLRLLEKPTDLYSVIQGKHSRIPCVIIDEVQRIPDILNEVHRLIEREKLSFLLTGSSARKLRRNQANLLGGRARQAELFPLTSAEIPTFDLERYLLVGGLPMVYFSDEPFEDLLSYVNIYLKEEIQTEALVRELPPFVRFLKFSALTSGEIVNFTNIASDAAVPLHIVRDYYSILEDTFIGFLLPAWTKTVKRKPTSKSKFYYFDLGVKNALIDVKQIPKQSDLYGKSFEHFIALELRAYLSYHRKHVSLCYWQTKNGQEVDFILGDEIAIEVKSTERTSEKHTQGLTALLEEKICKRYFLISHDTIARRVGKIEIIHWKTFLAQLWADEIL
ncbi:MAG: ATPase [Gammaproteobacteria bacterium RIFCSPLOWO2_02_FULL_42_14]|nr:MAG: ATPase [Gammaproteobacteria bacterium RIFCSPHIGHO2_02_FULL_42_43]OGT51206.1 MAG: ATPase [Gammaproteobacteria bacterium RIFCSPHIGHO2_12_FULL_41_25]OGT62967.1 MAG: ATPase [Gammaproteobacteria bacterium RIFCSPLOWO2_02_FULL_42_14]OGT86100.1 MAG: ATPase [Gammaproteobacteria bacterium RIFCSPLOWO2_12_FULL_42_18]